VRLVALLDANTARAQNLERCWSRQGKLAVRAFHMADAFDGWSGQHTGLAQHFQRKARPHDVHDRIDRANLVEMDFLRWMPVDFSFRHRHPIKHCDGFFFHPRRQLAALNHRPNVSERSFLDVGSAGLRPSVMVVMFYELRLKFFDASAALNPEHRLELVWLRQFLRSLQILAAALESEKLSPLALTICLQRHVLRRHWFRSMAVLIEKIEAKPRRHVRLEDAQFNVSGFCSGIIWRLRDQRASVRTVVFFFEMVAVLRAVRVVCAPSRMRMGMRVRQFTVSMLVCVNVLMFVLERQMHVELGPGDTPSLLARDMEVVSFQTKRFQFMFEPAGIDAEIDHGAHEHVPADATEDIQVEGFHFSSPAANALI